jgi:hypothetical protein
MWPYHVTFRVRNTPIFHPIQVCFLFIIYLLLNRFWSDKAQSTRNFISFPRYIKILKTPEWFLRTFEYSFLLIAGAEGNGTHSFVITSDFLQVICFLSLFYRKIHVKSDIFTMCNLSSECSDVLAYFHKVMSKWYGTHCYLKRYGTQTISVFEIILK